MCAARAAILGLWRVVAVQPEDAVLRQFRLVFVGLGAAVLILALLVVLVGLRWAQLHAMSLRLLQQNNKLLKQHQQRRTLDRGRPDGEAQK